MKMEKSAKTVLKFNNDAYTNTYVSRYADSVEIDIRAEDTEGVSQMFEMHLPIEVARKLSSELATDLKNYDEEVDRLKREELEKELEGLEHK